MRYNESLHEDFRLERMHRIDYDFDDSIRLRRCWTSLFSGVEVIHSAPSWTRVQFVLSGNYYRMSLSSYVSSEGLEVIKKPRR
ncbi:uncharacterized protein EI97DRAFT_320936 [Westerdykella ornata]|uniref:Uncharacterized protein n=1 Tax=Westerdykella ornata TaxID=318751 RepID=A0A6A6JP86_WESOR|nr:uncharacterized protein EI97DRAFT_320936 [Westerdykella ornata]KAF2276759.1 hypothetical protein EI97DRAFT_320936 [Westerdykella ornata]